MELFRITLEKKLTPTLINQMVAPYGIRDVDEAIEMHFGWQNLSFAIRSNEHNYVVRIYNPNRKTTAAVTEELKVMQYSSGELPIPLPLSTTANMMLTQVKVGKQNFTMALFQHLPGQPINELNEKQVIAAAAVMARLHQKLKDYPEKLGKSPFQYQKILKEAEVMLSRRLRRAAPWPYNEIITKPELQKQLKAAVGEFQELAESSTDLFKHLTIIHGDFHQSNFKYIGNRLSGLFDFDDIMYAPRIVDMAIAIARIQTKQPTSPKFARYNEILPLFVKGYKSVSPLTETEKSALLILVHFYLWQEMGWILLKPRSDHQLLHHKIMLKSVLRSLRQYQK